MGEEQSPAFQFYAKDWLVDTAHMTYEEKGVYIDSLCYAWIDVGLPDDTPRLQRIFKLSAHKMKKVWPAVGEKFSVVAGRLVNGRMERERQKQALRREKQSDAGKAGAKARWRQSHGDPNADAMPIDSSSSSTALERETYSDNESKDSLSSETSTASKDAGVVW